MMRNILHGYFMGKTLEPPDFPSIHKRAKEIVEQDTVLAYAIGTELRKRLVGRSSEINRQELLSRLAYSSWNQFIELDAKKLDPRYTQYVLDLVTDTLIVGYDILTERIRLGND